MDVRYGLRPNDMGTMYLNFVSPWPDRETVLGYFSGRGATHILAIQRTFTALNATLSISGVWVLYDRRMAIGSLLGVVWD
ncbi:hypothetical protein CPB85DRAFT_1567489 [Mucidula mucida]|nr:hypothetical protein CPB85DRAFT_1567489 [Mucidula mucida]